MCEEFWIPTLSAVCREAADVEARRAIFLINERALFEWIVSSGSMQEALDKHDPGHMQWLWDIADHSEVCLEGGGPTAESKARLAERKFGISARKTGCSYGTRSSCVVEAFLMVERRR